MRRWIVAALLLLCLPVVGRGQSIRYYPDSTSYTLGKTESGILYRAASANPTLLDGLVSYWPLDEISGVRYDAVGSNDLTDNNTVGAVLRGPEGTVASFVAANSEYLSDAGLVTDVGGGSFSWAAWIKNDPTSANCSYAGQALDGLHVVRIYSDTGVGGRISTTVYNHPADVTASVTGYSGDSWRLIVGGYDSASQKTFISVNGAAKTVSANTSAMIANIQSVDFWIGRADYPGYSTMQSGASGFWDVVLTDEQITALFASGNGLRYADLPAGLQTGLVSWWELDEVSGVRYDSHGSNDLTDNNTVGSATAEAGAMDGAAASFVEANSEYLDISAGAIPVNSDFTVTFWGWHNDTAGNIAYFPFKTKTTSADQHGVFLEASWSGSHRMYNRRAYGTAVELGDNAGKWVLYLYEYNHATTTTRCMALGSAANSGVWSADSVADLGAATTYFSLLRNEAGVGSVLFRVDEVAIWDRVLTSDRITELWNAGAGVYYPTFQ